MKQVPAEVYKRVVGYYRPVSQANPGKQAEMKERIEFDVNSDKFNSACERLGE